MLKIISYNFDNNIEAHKLVNTAHKFGYDLIFIGQGKSFKNFRQAKIDLLIEEIEKIDAEYLMFTDGLDSWFLRDDILEEYLKFNCDVVVSGNRDHYPATDLYIEYPNAPTTMRYICSSQFIGKKESLLNILRIMQREYLGYTCQEGWNYLYVKKLADFKIDHNCKLFLNMTNVTLDELDNNLVFKETNIKPCSIHFGGAKGDSPNGIAMRKMYEICERIA